MARRKLDYKICTGFCGLRKPRDQFSPGQGKCRDCRWTHRKHVLGEQTDYARSLENKRKRIADLQAILPKDQTVCAFCENAMPLGSHISCDLCREQARERTKSPDYKAKVQARIQPVIDWMNDLKMTIPCTDCGRRFRDPSYLDWDHLPGTEKIRQVSYFVHHGLRTQAEAEMVKCELVCKACHTKRGLVRGQTQYYGHTLKGDP